MEAPIVETIENPPNSDITVTNDIYYIRVVSENDRRGAKYGPFSVSEWDPKESFREFQICLEKGYSAEIVTKWPKDPQGRKEQKAIRRRWSDATSWAAKIPLAEFNKGNSRWVKDGTSYVLINKSSEIWKPSLYIFPEALRELKRITDKGNSNA